MASNIVNRVDISGTSFLLDVTPLELSLNLSVADFQVTHNGVVNNSYTKTSDTLLQYSGTNVTLGTRIVARRITPLVPTETNFLSTTTAVDLSNALDKLRLECDELSGYINYIANQVVQGGLTLGSIPINNGAYPTGWSGDTNNAPSRNALLNQFLQVSTSQALLAPLLSPVFTGTPTAPTQASTDSSTRIATTAYARSMATATALVGGQISYTIVPIGLVMKTGTTVVTVAANIATVNYTVSFPSTVISVLVVNGDGTVSTSGVNVNISNTAGFQINTPTYAAGAYRVNWVAFGN
jgi:hypothetical protein